MATYQPETCAFCRGTGRVKTQVLGNETSCISCNGTGWGQSKRFMKHDYQLILPINKIS